jgi:hypothetical protein
MEERIVNLLVPELKVNDVMLLIKKMKQAGKSDADEFSELDAEQKSGTRVKKWAVSLALVRRVGLTALVEMMPMIHCSPALPL